MRALDQAQKVAVESGRGTIQAVDVELFLEEMIEISSRTTGRLARVLPIQYC